MRGGNTLGMTIVMRDDGGDNERSYGFDIILTVRAKNTRIAYGA